MFTCYSPDGPRFAIRAAGRYISGRPTRTSSGRQARSLVPRAHLLPLVLAALVVSAGALHAQPRTAGLAGRVVDQATGLGVPRAAVVMLPSGPRAVTDSQGRFLITGITPGFQRFLAQAHGFPMAQLVVELRAGEAGEVAIALDSATTTTALNPVTVTAKEEPRRNYRLVDFERRRLTGRGQYLDQEEIEKSGASNLAELTRGMRGVALHCGGPGGCQIQMVRAKPNCPPDYVVDGRKENMFGMTTPIRDIVGLEVYTGPADVPGEFTGTTAGCGVVVIWTRSGPDRKQ